MLVAILIKDNLYEIVYIMCEEAPEYLAYKDEIYKWSHAHPKKCIAYYTLDFEEIA